MKPTPGLVVIFLFLLFTGNKTCSAQFLSFQNPVQNSTFASSTSDSFFSSPPQIYAEAHLLFGGEVTNLFDNEKTVVTGTPLWKTDVRVGVAQKVTENISSFISIRDDDHPQTGSFSLYEAGLKATHSWGYMLFGQTRLQAGNHSYYLNQAFDRPFWDKALIYDYLFRGARSSIQIQNTETELFFGTGQTAFFLWGGKLSLYLLDGFTTRFSGIYVARDNQYAAFGPGIGMEVEETVGSFRGYQVIGFKNLYQDPSRIKEVTTFTELRYVGQIVEAGVAGFFRRMEDKFRTLDEIRFFTDGRVHFTDLFSPGLQIEYFEKLGFSEIQYGIFTELIYRNGIRIVPRFRYIIPEKGKDTGFLGLECHFVLGGKE